MRVTVDNVWLLTTIKRRGDLSASGVPSQKNADAAAAGITAGGDEERMPVDDAPIRRPDSIRSMTQGPGDSARVGLMSLHVASETNEIPYDSRGGKERAAMLPYGA